MNMNSQCLWEKVSSVDINPISVVLQQVSSRKKETILACVCEGLGEGRDAAMQSGYFTERLVEWFHRKFLKKLLENGRETEISKALEEELKRIMWELNRYAGKKGAVEIQYSGILTRNSQCWVFCRGATGMFLFNRRYNKEHVKPIVLSGENTVWEGRVQKNVGILLCSHSFRKVFQNEEVLEVLFKGKRCDEAQLEKRLKELWREGEARGLEKTGAIYIRTY